MAKATKPKTEAIVEAEEPQRTSFSILPSKTRKLKVIAAENGTTMQFLVDEGLQLIIDKYSKKNK